MRIAEGCLQPWSSSLPLPARALPRVVIDKIHQWVILTLRFSNASSMRVRAAQMSRLFLYFATSLLPLLSTLGSDARNACAGVATVAASPARDTPAEETPPYPAENSSARDFRREDAPLLLREDQRSAPAKVVEGNLSCALVDEGLAAAWQRLGPELFAGFGFQALRMDRTRGWIRRADLPCDLLG